MSELVQLITYEDLTLGNSHLADSNDWWGVAVANTDMWHVIYHSNESMSAFNFANELLANGQRNIALIVPTPRRIIEGEIA